MLFLHAAHLHTEVLRLNDHHHSERIEGVLDTVFDLGRKPLLHLKPTGIDIDNTGYLTKPGNTSVRNICHMYLAEERQHVMLAERIEIDIFDHHHLTIILFKERGTQDRLRIFVVTFAKELQRFSHALRSFHQPLAGRIFSDLLQGRLHRLSDRRCSFFSLMKCLQIHHCNTCILSRTI